MTSPRIPPYGTPDAPLLAVRGEAELETDPDLAHLGITVTARGKERRTTLDDLTRRNATVVELIKSYGDAVEDVSTGAVSLTPELERRGRGERVHAYHGRVHLTAELTDFTALGELATRLADLDLTRVDGPWWTLRPDSPVHRAARRQAVQDAVRRAKEYAEALGTTVGALIELADTGTGSVPGRPRSGFGSRVRRMSTAAEAEETAPEPLDLEPQRMRVRAEVSAQFTMVPPTL
ncbi:SIMPL domain-containing protein [Streptomyces sp. NBC_00582]|uniref:SIMPL domain-containing protein n=1 Tax=Streptomyces sp. NBC_00582 TaxID=2975783 RepID=UPI0010629290|nr:SIMPL domain-containing protein [Streptomyces sp. NBC_00582]WUB65440.1 SIMPL domain-containing protein [Streptomyces sp. NBC_00582]